MALGDSLHWRQRQTPCFSRSVQLALVQIFVHNHLAVTEDAMDVVSYSDARANLKGVMDRVVNDRTHVVITRQKAEAVVVVSLEDWNAMEETMHLLSTPANAERLRESIRQLENGGGTERELVTEREAAA
jgi:antitoxin YefM